jgi:ankyrin repeat protein
MKSFNKIILALLFVASISATAFATGNNDLIKAVQKGDFTSAVVLLDEGMNPNIIESGQSPLMIAARNGEIQITRALVAFGADVNLRNDDGTTALMLAARNGNTLVVEMLLKAGADADLRNNRGFTSADLARMFKHDQTLNLLRQTNLR